MTQIFSPEEFDPLVLRDRRVALIGYGAQGRAHALNLRDSGVQVIVGQRSGPGFATAVADGFAPVPIAQAARESDVVNVLLPDEVHGTVFDQLIAPGLRPGQVLMACHGFSFHYGLMVPPPGIDFVLVAPKGAGPQVRGQYVAGGGVPCLIATSPKAKPESLAVD
jgi:ketol-acid reductoisomerase